MTASPVGKQLWPLLVAALLGLTACSSQSDWKLKDITGLMPELQFTLTDHSGETVTAQDYRGRVVMLYFGFTHCPDICPTTLATLKRALVRVGDPARDARVLFVSVDPHRDTVPVLRRYVTAFGDRYVGLRGEEPTLRELTKRYRVTFGYGDDYPDGAYNVSHSSAVFIFDRQGDARLLARKDDPVDAIAHDLRRLLQNR